MQAGYKVILSFDNDPRCVETQLTNPRYLNHCAIRSDVENMLNGEALRIANVSRGELFLLAGGPPCQGFSVQRIGKDEDPRNTLVEKFFAIVEETYPLYFLMENVVGIRGKRGHSVFNRSIKKAESLGYQVSVACLDAQDYGVPQRRKRIFMLGNRLNGTEFEFPVAITPQGHRITVRETIGHIPPPPEDGSEHPEIKHHKRDKLSPLNIRRLQALAAGQGRDHLPEDLLADCHKQDSSKIGHRNVYGRMRWDDVAPTITARFDSFTRGLFGHPEQTRSITLREGALLQTFPSDFIFSGTKVEIARQIGNAVPPKLAEIIGKQIITHYKQN